MKKMFYVFAIALIALIIVPNTIMGVSACSGFDYVCDDDCTHLTLSDKLANIDPRLAEIDFDALLADIAQYEGDFFIVIYMQEVYEQIDVLSVGIVDEGQLGLLIIYAEGTVDLLLIMPLNTDTVMCSHPNLVFRGVRNFYIPELGISVSYSVWWCSRCNSEVVFPLFR